MFSTRSKAIKTSQFKIHNTAAQPPPLQQTEVAAAAAAASPQVISNNFAIKTSNKLISREGAGEATKLPWHHVLHFQRDWATYRNDLLNEKKTHPQVTSMLKV